MTWMCTSPNTRSEETQEDSVPLPEWGQEEHHRRKGQGDPSRMYRANCGPHQATFGKMLPDKDCFYALYNVTCKTKGTEKGDLVFVLWVPDSAPLKSKIIHGGSKDVTKKELTGIKH